MDFIIIWLTMSSILLQSSISVETPKCGEIVKINLSLLFISSCIFSQSAQTLAHLFP